jgi:thioredoxin 1
MTKVVHVKSTDHWNEIVTAHEDNGSVLVCKFSSSWCRPCLALAPKIDSLSLTYDENKVLFLSIDIEENEEIAEKFNITSMPTTLIIRNCKIIKTVVGADLVAIKGGIDNIFALAPYN